MVMDMRSTRLALRLTQTELAAKLGVTQGTISRFETGALAVDERTRLALEALSAKPRPRRIRSAQAAA